MLDQAKRECILDAAVRAFRRLGFRKTSIDDVASEARVGKGTVYMAVRSKDELYLKAVERELAQWLADHAALAGDFSAAGLARLVHAEIDSARRRPLVHPILSGRLADTLEGVDLPALRRTARTNLALALGAGVGAGRFRREVDPETSAEVLQAIEIAALSAHPAIEPPPGQSTAPTPEAIGRLVSPLVAGLLPRP
ncbi:MAG: TetR family transcriptional regulator [Deltaproteobacteria bacterium]|nr:TetR family transcriptional regulator [Deltaproteobacteria bacterium]